MANKIYLKKNVIEGGREFFYTDIGLTLGGHNSYRLWISMYVLKDEIGEYISFPIKDAIIEQGKQPSTLKLKHKRGYNVYDIKLNDGSNYRLDSEHTSWKYYDQLNEGLLVVAPTAEVNVYYEDKEFIENRGNIKSNIYGFNTVTGIKEQDMDVVTLIPVIEEEDDGSSIPINKVISETLQEIIQQKRSN